MEETTDTRGAESPQETGVTGRMVGTLFSPGRTFASVNTQVEHKDWLIPLIVVAIVGMISAYLIMPIAQTEGMEAMREQIGEDEALAQAFKGGEHRRHPRRGHRHGCDALCPGGDFPGAGQILFSAATGPTRKRLPLSATAPSSAFPPRS